MTRQAMPALKDAVIRLSPAGQKVFIDALETPRQIAPAIRQRFHKTAARHRAIQAIGLNAAKERV